MREEDLKLLTPAQQRFYRVRMEPPEPLSVKECAEILGIRQNTAASQWSVISRKLGYNPVSGLVAVGKPKGDEQKALEELRRAAPQTLPELLGEKARILLDQIDEKRAAKAGVGELARGAEALIKSRNLSLGEPTQILRVDDRRNLTQIIAALAQEAQNRGFSLSGGRLVREEPVIDAQVVDDDADGA